MLVGDRSNMKSGDDGSLTIYIQKNNPGGDKESNWLPASDKGKFKVALRLYAPKKNVINGSWVPPAIMKTKN